MNLHIVDDEKFINGAVDLFEKYSPNKNVFILNSKTDELQYVSKINQVIILDFSSINIKKIITKIVVEKNIDKVFIHFLDANKAGIVNHLKGKVKIKTYWIFFGADLYMLLNEDYNYQLYDVKKKVELSFYDKVKAVLSKIKIFVKYGDLPVQGIYKCIKNMDYFCFWNHLDYELLLKHYETKAQFLNFAYFDALDKNPSMVENTNSMELVVNNSASLNGNHLTILEKIKKIDKNKIVDKIVVPLSYGSNQIVNDVMQYGRKAFNETFCPIVDFLDKETYFNLFQNVSVAFYGTRRQEASGNIFVLLAKGVKVFLRNDNNMMLFLKEKGFIVFSFEDDFNSIEDLKALKIEEKIMNNAKYIHMFSNEVQKEVMEEILLKS
jgi:dTDP-N-acetylfucosamine:lipid II N-acetylfucosaminyltransferase